MVPTVTDCDEWKYLDTLEAFDLVGSPYSADQGYYASVLRQKYPDATISLTATPFQVLHPGISAAPVPLSPKQRAQQWPLFDARDPHVTKAAWLQRLMDEDRLSLYCILNIPSCPRFQLAERGIFMPKEKNHRNTYHARSLHPFVPNPCAPYGAWGLGAFILVGDDDPHQSLYRFDTVFHTPISVVDWCHDGSVLLARSMTGEVLAQRFRTGERLLANRHAHSYAPKRGVVLVLFGIIFLLTLIMMVEAMSGTF